MFKQYKQTYLSTKSSNYPKLDEIFQMLSNYCDVIINHLQHLTKVQHYRQDTVKVNIKNNNTDNNNGTDSLFALNVQKTNCISHLSAYNHITDIT